MFFFYRKKKKRDVWVLALVWYYIGHIGHMVTVIYMYSFPNYLREGILDGLLLLGLKRFGGVPGGGPGTAAWVRGRFFGSCGFGRACTFFGIFNRGCGLSFLRLLGSWLSAFKLRFFGITTSSSLAESSSSESSTSLNSSRSGSFAFFQRLRGSTFDMSNSPFLPHKNCSAEKNIITCKMWHAACFIHKTRHMILKVQWKNTL